MSHALVGAGKSIRSVAENNLTHGDRYLEPFCGSGWRFRLVPVLGLAYWFIETGFVLFSN